MIPTNSPAAPFPLIVGVTGHRDILPTAREALEKTVHTVLDGLQQQFGADAVFLLSALAQGADQLIAGAAHRLGMPLIAVSPMPLDAYRDTLRSDPDALAGFERYWSDAHLRLVLPWVTTNEPDHKLQYEQLGVVLSRYAHVLLALWDGTGAWHTLHTDTERQAARGGTAHVLHLRRNDEREAEGFGRRSLLFKDAGSRLNVARGGPVLHIVTPRAKTGGSVASSVVGSIQVGDCILLPMQDQRGQKLCENSVRNLFPTLGDKSKKEFEQIRRLNCMLRRFDRVDQRKHAVQVKDLRPQDPALDPTGEQREHLALLRNLQAGADAAAQHFQRRLLGELLPIDNPRSAWRNAWSIVREERRLPNIGALVVFTALTPLALILFEAYADFESLWWALFGYFVLVAAGTGVYERVVHRQEWQNRFQDYRALAEAMRVQLFWAAAALPRAVSDHYLRLQRDELGWVQFALRGPALWAAALALALQHPCRGLVTMHWIQHQREYFLGKDGRSGKTGTNRAAWERSEAWVARFGYSGLAISGLVAALEAARLIGTWSGWFTPPAHTLTILRGVLLLLVAGAGGAAASVFVSAQRRAYEAHANSYATLGQIFAKAEREAQGPVCAGDDREYQALVFDLGREALTENASWLQDHRRRPIANG